MPHPSNISFPKSEYYRKYYVHNKHVYKINYENKKRREQFEEIYKPFGGEKQYHYNSLMKWIKEEKENSLLEKVKTKRGYGG